MGGSFSAERVATGVEGLDEMLAGGLLRGSTTLVKGAPGTGKTCLGLEFLATGAMQEGESGAFISFEHFPRKLHRDAQSIGVPLKDLEERGLIRTVFTSPEIFISQVKQADGLLDRMVQEMGLARIVVDSISHLERLSEDPLQLREISYSFINGLMRHNLTSIITQEEPEILGTSATAAEFGISYLVDTVIQLSYVEVDSSISRALLILKQRASGHDKAIRQFRITDSGIKVEKPFEDREGVLSGVPVRRELEAFMEVFGKKKQERRKGR